MVQSFNYYGIKSFFKVILDPKLAKPHLIVKDLRSIPFQKLYDSGIRFLAFDKDNCLTRPYENKLYEPFEESWRECKRIFSSENIVIVSNSIGTDSDFDMKDAKIVVDSLGVDVLQHKVKKPCCGEELIAHFESKIDSKQISSMNKIQNDQIAVIGDRLLTDIVFGNLYGFYTVYTRKVISLKNDNLFAKYIRMLEHRFTSEK
ncbi:hypothetical protein BB559_000389 [Furculomyces boomerangus]|uniref:Uncharacterized protein n=2 Tax=Harpellales TaxID=61421 RepID=A0A2T9Z5D5_9FUNG|nr:hypothetical protein BB559_000389 [Furculomyces boomerangus]PVZ99224.1 hypothetical protein BB558_004764 [Smittium angustum]